MTIHTYPDIAREEQLETPDYPPEIDDACAAIKDACDGWGTDEDKLIKILGSKTPYERYLINRRWGELRSKTLRKRIGEEFRDNDLGKLIQFLAQPLEEAECEMIRLACRGAGTNESLLYPIICGRSNEDMQVLKKTYFEKYEKDIAIALDGELSGDFEKLIFYSLQAAEEEFNEEYHTEEKADEDADAFYEAGQGSWGTDEGKMFKILVNSPPEYLEMVDAKYSEKYGYTLWKAMEKELTGYAEKAAVFIFGMKIRPAETVAKLIKSTCAGIGTDELELSCAVVRYQRLLPEVIRVHEDIFDGKTLEDRIRSETRGKYERLLLEIVRVRENFDPSDFASMIQ